MTMLLSVLLACAGMPPAGEGPPTLRTVMARQCVGTDSLADAHREVAGFGIAARWPQVIIAFYFANGLESLPEDMRIASFDRLTGVWRHVQLGQGSGGGQAVAEIVPTAESIFVRLTGSHARDHVLREIGLTPSHERLLVLGPELGVRRLFNGRLLKVLADGRAVLQASNSFDGSLRLYSPHTNTDTLMFRTPAQMTRLQVGDFRQENPETLRFTATATAVAYRFGSPDAATRIYDVTCSLVGFVTCTPVQKQ